jgi:Flp pilus assembly protein TadD
LVFLNQGKTDKAVEDFTADIQLNPMDGEAYQNRGWCQYQRHNWGQATNDFKNAIQINSKNSLAYNNYAWLLASCPESSFRDGGAAVKLALKACELTKWENWKYIDTLGASYAEAGDFDQAVKFQKKSMELGLPEKEMKDAEAKLTLYQKKKPYHTEQ